MTVIKKYCVLLLVVVTLLVMLTGVRRTLDRQHQVVRSLQTSFDSVTTGMARKDVEELMSFKPRLEVVGPHVQWALEPEDVATTSYTLVFAAPLLLDPAFAIYFDEDDKVVAKRRFD